MPTCVRLSRKRVVYTGRISRRSFAAWTETPAGGAAVHDVASTIRFALLGKAAAARRRLWRELLAVARDASVREALQAEVQLYLTRLGSLACCPGLPRDTVQRRRLVVVPTVLLNGDVYGALCTKLGKRFGSEPMAGREALLDFFILQVIHDLDAAARRTGPSPKDPVKAGPSWMSVGLNDTFDWRLPMLNQPVWAGHHYVLESTPEPITRALRKAVHAHVTGMEASIPMLSRLERNDILRRARYVA